MIYFFTDGTIINTQAVAHGQAHLERKKGPSDPPVLTRLELVMASGHKLELTGEPAGVVFETINLENQMLKQHLDRITSRLITG